MPKKFRDWQHVGFRIPREVYDDLVATARLRGVDLTAVFNWIIAEYRPRLVAERVAHERAMAQAVAVITTPTQAEAA